MSHKSLFFSIPTARIKVSTLLKVAPIVVCGQGMSNDFRFGLGPSWDNDRCGAHVVANEIVAVPLCSLCPVRVDQTGGSGMPCSCDKCGSLRAARRGSAGQEARQGSPQGSPRGSATHASPPSGRGDTDLARPCRSRPDAGQQGRGGDANAMSPGPAAEEERLLANSSDGCEEEETLARAGAAFENGMEAYMREDPEVGGRREIVVFVRRCLCCCVKGNPEKAVHAMR